MTTYYRVIYRDGSHGAWSTDKEWVEHIAKKYRAIVDTKEV